MGTYKQLWFSTHNMNMNKNQKPNNKFQKVNKTDSFFRNWNLRFGTWNINSRGFTFLEVIISVFLFSVIVALVAGFSLYYFRNYSFTFEEQQQVGQAQTALTQMIREIRKARPGDNGSWPLVQTDDSTFIFYSDVNGDNRTDRIRYFVSGTELRRGVIQPTAVPVTYPAANEIVTTLMSSVEATASPIFTYYNGSWPADTANNPLSAAQRILHTRYVKIAVRLNATPNFAANGFELSSGVTIRSMKTNL